MQLLSRVYGVSKIELDLGRFKSQSYLYDVTQWTVIIAKGGFREGAEGAAAPLFSCIFKTFLYDPNPSNGPSCNQVEAKFQAAEGGRVGPLFLNFLDPTLIALSWFCYWEVAG